MQRRNRTRDDGYARVLLKGLGFIGLLSYGALTSATASDVLQQHLNHIKTLEAHFSQKVFAEKKLLSSSAGIFYLSRPSKFRWNVEEPLEQQLIADGKRLWIYDVDLSQVTSKAQAHSLDGPAALFLSGEVDTVSRDYNVHMTQKNQSEIFDLQAKTSKVPFRHMIFIFKHDQLAQIQLLDTMGQRTLFDFNHMKLNQSLSAKLFQFKIPHGVDLVEQ